jgi:hypothetical protein
MNSLQIALGAGIFKSPVESHITNFKNKGGRMKKE